MSDKVFVDTNVLIYAHDSDAESKHGEAERRLRQLWDDRTGVLSTQVLQEFYVNATRKIALPLPKHTARLIVDTYSTWCIEVTPSDISVAFRIEDEAHLGFWDSLIIASALKAGATRLLTEDINAGQVIAGVEIENPFAHLSGREVT